MPQNVNFEQLYRSHYRRVYGLCRKLLGSSAIAEDAAQEVFMRAYRSLGRYDGSQPFAGWVLKIARNYCVDVARRRTKEARLFGDEDVERAELESGDVSALAELVSLEQTAAVRKALEALPDKHRIPLVLAYYEEASYEEIAIALGITRNHVGVLILRAKQALRRGLTTDQPLGDVGVVASATDGERK